MLKIKKNEQRKLKRTKPIKRQTFMSQTVQSTLVCDYLFENERNMQCREGYFTVTNEPVHTEDITLCSV